MTVLIFLLVIIFLVVAHELGHFLVAKWCKVRVDEFGVGYPPRAKKLFTWKGTLFTLNWLPFGGFVKIYGEDGSDEKSPDLFTMQPLYKRAAIIIAGIAANMLVAMVLYAISFSIGLLGAPEDFPGARIVSDERVYITNILEDSPADSIGLRSGDAIVGLSSGVDIMSEAPKVVTDVTNFIKTHADDEIEIQILRGNETLTFSTAPEEGVAEGQPGLGVSIIQASHIRLPFFKALTTGVVYTFEQFGNIVRSLGMLIGSAFDGEKGSMVGQVAGPVGIAQIAGSAFTLGLGSFLAFVALISINLAVINLLPFPALDGGRFVIELFSKKGKSRIPMRVISTINQVGFLLLILLMLYVTYKDILRII